MITNSIIAKAMGNSVLIEPGNYKVDFPYPVAETVIFSDVVIVRVEPPVGIIFNENIFGISLTGDLLWQIKTLKHVYGDSPYTSVKEVVSGIKLSNWDGDDVIVNPKTGSILQVGYSK